MYAVEELLFTCTFSPGTRRWNHAPVLHAFVRRFAMSRLIMNEGHLMVEKNALEDAKGYYAFSMELSDANTEAMSGMAHVQLQVLTHNLKCCTDAGCPILRRHGDMHERSVQSKVAVETEQKLRCLMVAESRTHFPCSHILRLQCSCHLLVLEVNEVWFVDAARKLQGDY